MKRRFRWLLILVILAAFAVWLEPTRVVWGWLRGEAFYHGRPTSYWEIHIRPWRSPQEHHRWFHDRLRSIHQGPIRTRTEAITFFPELHPLREELNRRGWLGDTAYSLWPAVLDGDPRSAAVLRELEHSKETRLREWASVGLQRIETGERGPQFNLNIPHPVE